MRHKTAEEKAEGFNIFFIRGTSSTRSAFFSALSSTSAGSGPRPVALVTLIASIWTISVFVRNWEPIWAGTMQLYKFVGKPLPDALQFFFILSFIGFFHEFGHGYAVKIYGGEVHDIGMALFYFTPVFYCDTADAFMFTNKWHRLTVIVTGIYIEAAICSGATLVLGSVVPGLSAPRHGVQDDALDRLRHGVLQHQPADQGRRLLRDLVHPGAAGPAGRILSLSGIPAAERVFRLPVSVPPMNRRKQLVYVLYGILSMGYTASIMVVIAGALSNFYYKYFPNAAIVLLLLTLYYIFRKRVRVLTRTFKLMYLDKKELLMSPRSGSLAAIAVAIVLLLVVPWSRRTIRAEATLKPSEIVRLEAPEDGIVAEVLAGEGDLVEAGQPLFRVVSAATEEERGRLTAQRNRFRSSSTSGRAASDPGLVFQSERRASSADAAPERGISESDLVVRSPISGRILTHRPADLMGRFVSAGALLAEVGDCRKMTADIGVSGASCSTCGRALRHRSRARLVVAQPSGLRGRHLARDGRASPSPPASRIRPRRLPPQRRPIASSHEPCSTTPTRRAPAGRGRAREDPSREGVHVSRASSAGWRWVRTLVW